MGIFVLLLASCTGKSEEQKYMERRAQEIAKEEAHKHYIDSLVNVATGLTGASSEQRRLSLVKLYQEYPSLSHKWDSVSVSIDKGEIY